MIITQNKDETKQKEDGVSKEENKLSDTINAVQAQINSAIKSGRPVNPFLNQESKVEIQKAISKLLNLPEGSTVIISPKAYNNETAVLAGVISTPDKDGNLRNIAFGIDNARGIHFGAESLGTSLKVRDLDVTAHSSWDAAKDALPMIIEGFKADGLQMPIQIERGGAVILANRGLNPIVRRSDGTLNPIISDSDLKKYSIVSKDKDGNMSVVSPNKFSKRVPVIGTEDVQIVLKTDSGAEHQIYLGNQNGKTNIQQFQQLLKDELNNLKKDGELFKNIPPSKPKP